MVWCPLELSSVIKYELKQTGTLRHPTTMAPTNESCVCCNVPLTKQNTPSPAMIERFWATRSGLWNARIVSSLEQYLERVTEEEEVEAGFPCAYRDTATVEKSDHLTVFQVRGFIREILTHRNRPREAARILRVLRRLQTRRISATVLFDTGIELAVALLRDQPSGEVQSLARAVLGEWLNQYPTIECSASPTQAEDSQNGSPASGTHQKALMQDSVDTAFEPDLGVASSNIVSFTKEGMIHALGLGEESDDTDITDQSDSSKNVSFVTAGERSDPTDIAKRTQVALNNHRNHFDYRPMSSLVREEMIASIGNPPNRDYPDSHNTPIEPARVAKILEPRYKHLKDFQSPKAVIRTSEDFLSTSKAYLGLDDEAMDLLAEPLSASYNGTIRAIELAAITASYKTALEAQSSHTRAKIHTNTVEIANTGHDEKVKAISPAAQRDLLQQRLNMEENLQEQKVELEQVVVAYEDVQYELLMNILQPLKTMSDVVFQPTAEGEAKLWNAMSQT